MANTIKRKKIDTSKMTKTDIFNKLKSLRIEAMELKCKTIFSQELVEIQFECYRLFYLFLKSRESFAVQLPFDADAFISGIFFNINEIHVISSMTAYDMHIFARNFAEDDFNQMLPLFNEAKDILQIKDGSYAHSLLIIVIIYYSYNSKPSEYAKYFAGENHSLDQHEVNIIGENPQLLIVPFIRNFSLMINEEKHVDIYDEKTWKYLIEFLSFATKKLDNKIMFKFIYDQILEILRQVNTPKHIVHYTSLRALEEIINSSELKISSTKLVNDLDEGTIWDKGISDISKQKSINVLSFTKKEDSLDLWGNYTNNNGVSLVFDESVINYLVVFSSEDKEEGILTYTYGDAGVLHYANEFPSETATIFNTIKNSITNGCSDKIIKISQEGLKMASNIQSFLYKKLPFEYEDEYRVIISAHTFKSLKTHHKNRNFTIKNNNVYKSFDIKQIKKVIMGPGIKDSKMIYEAIHKLFSENGYDDIIIEKSNANIRR